MCRSEVPIDGSKEDIKRLRHWVEKGEVWAMEMLGDSYKNGKGVTQSHEKAAKLYKLAADQGHATAQCNLGLMYKHGRGVKQSDEKAVELYKLAADQGHASAMLSPCPDADDLSHRSPPQPYFRSPQSLMVCDC